MSSTVKFDTDNATLAIRLRDALILSPAQTVIIPIQDWLLTTDQINIPGTEKIAGAGNGNWRFAYSLNLFNQSQAPSSQLDLAHFVVLASPTHFVRRAIKQPYGFTSADLHTKRKNARHKACHFLLELLMERSANWDVYIPHHLTLYIKRILKLFSGILKLA